MNNLLNFLNPNETILVLRKYQPFDIKQNIAPFLSKVIFIEANFFQDKEHLFSFIKTESVSKILLFSPYANAANKRVYDWVRESNSSYIVCEKGALPDSIYLDDTGFLNDSIYYRPEHWNHALTQEQRQKITHYIREVMQSGVTRESNPSRTSLSQIQQELGIDKNRRVLFVSFQRKKDAVVRYFCGHIKSYDDFYNLIQSFAITHSDWQVVYKNHPNEKEPVHVENAICADDYHVYDLIELSDAVALINSGVGIYSLMFGKPTYLLGDAWYANNELNVSIVKKQNLYQCLMTPFSPDDEIALRFLHYLRFSFYSFVRVDEASDGSSKVNLSFDELGYVPMIMLSFLRDFKKTEVIKDLNNAS